LNVELQKSPVTYVRASRSGQFKLWNEPLELVWTYWLREAVIELRRPVLPNQVTGYQDKWVLDACALLQLWQA
jgi:hypothetical protein